MYIHTHIPTYPQIKITATVPDVIRPEHEAQLCLGQLNGMDPGASFDDDANNSTPYRHGPCLGNDFFLLSSGELVGGNEAVSPLDDTLVMECDTDILEGGGPVLARDKPPTVHVTY